jgi:hypothetical protein
MVARTGIFKFNDLNSKCKKQKVVRCRLAFTEKELLVMDYTGKSIIEIYANARLTSISATGLFFSGFKYFRTSSNGTKEYTHHDLYFAYDGIEELTTGISK